ncbi:hypothetical protein K8I28_10805, partial [bacterium]|nr:hypothetical protein [bacterium]
LHISSMPFIFTIQRSQKHFPDTNQIRSKSFKIKLPPELAKLVTVGGRLPDCADLMADKNIECKFELRKRS